jgi:hypothetical protein
MTVSTPKSQSLKPLTMGIKDRAKESRLFSLRRGSFHYVRNPRDEAPRWVLESPETPN